MKTIILVGAPGSGKGTLCQSILSILPDFNLRPEDVFVLSMGDILRQEVESKTTLGEELVSFMQKGSYVPDALIMRIIKEQLKKVNYKLVIQDGFPRTITQLEAQNVAASVIYCNVDDQTIIERIKSRRICKECKYVHTLEDKYCPKCGGQSLIRADDAKIEERLVQYHANTLPMINKMQILYEDNFYEIRGSLKDTNIAEILMQKIMGS